MRKAITLSLTMHSAMLVGVAWYAHAAIRDEHRPSVSWVPQQEQVWLPPAPEREVVEVEDTQWEPPAERELVYEEHFEPEELDPPDAEPLPAEKWTRMSPELQMLRVAPPREPEPPPVVVNEQPEPTPPVAYVEARILADVNQPPDYPRRARARGHEGEVWVEVTVGTDGTALEVRVVDPSPYASLNRAAVRAVEEWQFAPASRGGEPIEATLRIPIIFRLEAG